MGKKKRAESPAYPDRTKASRQYSNPWAYTEHPDRFSRLFDDQFMSPAFQDLTDSAVRLYLVCVHQIFEEREKPIPGDISSFTMPRAKWSEKYKLYGAGRKGRFYDDMTNLIEHGFVKCVSCGAISRTASVYRFSDRWKKWGTPDYQIPPEDMTEAMRRRAAKKAAAAAAE